MNLIGQVVFHVCDIYRIKEKALDKTWIQSPSIMTCMIQWEGPQNFTVFLCFPGLRERQFRRTRTRFYCTLNILQIYRHKNNKFYQTITYVKQCLN